MSEEKELVVTTDIAPKTEKETEKSTVIDFKMVTFSLADRDYSIDIMHVKEIAKASRFTYVPNTLPFVLGVYNLRGEIIPILDLRLFFNIPVPPRDENKLENMLILAVDEQKFGVVVDKIDKVIGVQRSTIQPPHPLFGDINIKYIDGVVESNNRLYVLLDITKIFSSKEVAESHTANRYQPKPQVVEVNNAIPAQNAGGGLKAAASAVAANENSAASAAKSAQKEPEVDLKFIKESLQNYSKYFDFDNYQDKDMTFEFYDDANHKRFLMIKNLCSETNILGSLIIYYGLPGMGKSITLIKTFKYEYNHKIFGTLYINCKYFFKSYMNDFNQMKNTLKDVRDLLWSKQ